MLNDEQLWDKCGSGQRITFDDLGLDPYTRRNNTQIHRKDFGISNMAQLYYNIGIVLISGMVIGLLVITLI